MMMMMMMMMIASNFTWQADGRIAIRIGPVREMVCVHNNWPV